MPSSHRASIDADTVHHMPSGGDTLLGTAEAARLAGTDDRRLRRLAAAGKLPAARTTGGRYLFSAQVLRDRADEIAATDRRAGRAGRPSPPADEGVLAALRAVQRLRDLAATRPALAVHLKRMHYSH